MFITLTTAKRRRIFLTAEVVAPLENALRHHIEEGNVDVGGYVIMPEHVHIIAAPGAMGLQKFVKDFKAYTGLKVKAAEGFEGGVWRPRFYSLPLPGVEEFAERVRMMHRNPVKAGLVRRGKEYPWSSCRAYAGLSSKVPVTVEELPPPPKMEKRPKRPPSSGEIVQEFFKGKRAAPVKARKSYTPKPEGDGG